MSDKKTVLNPSGDVGVVDMTEEEQMKAWSLFSSSKRVFTNEEVTLMLRFLFLCCVNHLELPMATGGSIGEKILTRLQQAESKISELDGRTLGSKKIGG